MGARQGMGVRAGDGSGLVLRQEQPGHEPDGPAHLDTHHDGHIITLSPCSASSETLCATHCSDAAGSASRGGFTRSAPGLTGATALRRIEVWSLRGRPRTFTKDKRLHEVDL